MQNLTVTNLTSGYYVFTQPITISQTITVTNSILVVNGSVVVSGGQIDLHSSSLTVEGDVTVSQNCSINVLNSTLVVNGSVNVGDGHIGLSSSSFSVEGDIIFSKNSSLTFDVSTNSHINVSSCATLAGNLTLHATTTDRNQIVNLITAKCINGSFQNFETVLDNANGTLCSEPDSTLETTPTTLSWVFNIINTCKKETDVVIWIILGIVLGIIVVSFIVFAVAFVEREKKRVRELTWMKNKSKNME